MSVRIDGGPFICGRATGLYQEVTLYDMNNEVIPLDGCTAYLEIRDDPTSDDPALLSLASDGSPTAGGSSIAITGDTIEVLISNDDAEDETIFPLVSKVLRYQRLIDTEIVVRADDGSDLVGAPIPFPILFQEMMTRPA